MQILLSQQKQGQATLTQARTILSAHVMTFTDLDLNLYLVMLYTW